MSHTRHKILRLSFLPPPKHAWSNYSESTGDGQGVIVLAFYSNDPSSNPAEFYRFNSVSVLPRTKINTKKRPGMSHFYKKNSHSNNNLNWAVVLAQLVEQLLPIPEILGSNPVIGKNLYWTCTVNCIEKTKIKKKRSGMAHFLTNIWIRLLPMFLSTVQKKLKLLTHSRRVREGTESKQARTPIFMYSVTLSPAHAPAPVLPHVDTPVVAKWLCEDKRPSHAFIMLYAVP